MPWQQAKSKRRIVVGMREVTKLIERKKLKAVLIAPDIEKIRADGGTCCDCDRAVTVL